MHKIIEYHSEVHLKNVFLKRKLLGFILDIQHSLDAQRK